MATTTAHIRRHERNRPNFLRDIIIIRLINAWWIATFFQPDEFFQSLEPAWRLAFGDNSGAWLTWVCFSTTIAPMCVASARINPNPSGMASSIEILTSSSCFLSRLSSCRLDIKVATCRQHAPISNCSRVAKGAAGNNCRLG